MSRFKFRMWDVKEGCYQAGHAFKISLNGEILLFGDKPKQNDYIIEQSTGLLDKNGKEIYEGDVLHHAQHNVNGKVQWDSEWASYCVIWEDLKVTRFEKWWQINDIEIIGNIHSQEVQ